MRLPTRCFAVVFAVAGLAVPAMAAPDKDDKGALGAVLVLLLIPPLQAALATMLPGFTRRSQRAIATGFWPSAGWGALLVVLTILVAGILNKGGQAGKGAAVALAVSAFVLAVAGGVGVSKCIGDWALRRWGLESMGPLSVLSGSLVWLWGALVPVIGWAAGLLSLFASLGAAAQVLLHPHAFDEPEIVRPADPPGERPP